MSANGKAAVQILEVNGWGVPDNSMNVGYWESNGMESSSSNDIYVPNWEQSVKF